MSAFTSYWTNKSWGMNVPDEGQQLRHIAANDFKRRGVKLNDAVYIVTNKQGKMYLCARIPVDKFVGQKEAERIIGEPLWPASQHVVSEGGTTMRFERQVPDDIVKALRLGEGEPLKFNAPGVLDNQTLRGVRRLTPESAALLDGLLRGDGPVGGNGARRNSTGTTASHATTPLHLVGSVDDLAASFQTFQREARAHRVRAGKILRTTKYWVRDEHSGAFGPGKFVGYKGMTFWLYEQGKAGETTGAKFNGGTARLRIWEVIGQDFQPDRGLEDQCRAWGEKLLGPNAFRNRQSKDWQFLEVSIPGREPRTDYPDDVTQPEKYVEGATQMVTVNKYERNRDARAACIAHHGAKCQVCDLDFLTRYGRIGEGFIHVHHLKQLAQIGEEYEVDPIHDLCPVCPNCHAMLHRQTPPLAIEALRAMFRR